MSAPGCSAAAIAAVTGSSSTPRHPCLTRCESDKVARPAARFKYLSANKPQTAREAPDRLHERGASVMGVQRGPPRRRQLGRRQQPGQPLPNPPELAARLVENLRNRAPPRPPAKHSQLLRRPRTATALKPAQQLQRREVGADPPDRTRRREVALPARPEGG